jgi:hypothetical protein
MEISSTPQRQENFRVICFISSTKVFLLRMKNLFIAPYFTDVNWRALDLKNREEDWQTAVNVLKERLYSRYIDPVDALIEAEKAVTPKNKRFGFTCLAIDFLLIETLQAFKEGRADTSGVSKAVFKRFLIESERFNRYFSTDDERNNFYSNFRCGILHQAEIQGPELVWSVGDLYDRSTEPHRLNRIFFHQELKREMDDYLDMLTNPNSVQLRDAFEKKMDSIVARGGSD